MRFIRFIMHLKRRGLINLKEKQILHCSYFNIGSQYIFNCGYELDLVL